METEIQKFIKISASRHLDLNQCFREAFCVQSNSDDSNSTSSEVVKLHPILNSTLKIQKI